MAHSEGHSSNERTILWIIIPATIAVSLYFTWQSGKHEQFISTTELSGDVSGMMKKEIKAPAKVEAAHNDTLHVDTMKVSSESTPAVPTEPKVETHSAH
jgi:hypothetical protein